jgi:hypothetical protein
MTQAFCIVCLVHRCRKWSRAKILFRNKNTCMFWVLFLQFCFVYALYTFSYAYCAWKFVYHFLSRYASEYAELSRSFRRGNVNELIHRHKQNTHNNNNNNNIVGNRFGANGGCHSSGQIEIEVGKRFVHRSVSDTDI